LKQYTGPFFKGRTKFKIVQTLLEEFPANIDFKLMTKCLAFRLKKVLPNIIHSDQTGFMRGRYIGDNIRNILEIRYFVSFSGFGSSVIILCLCEIDISLRS
jgi:hypothetical protein